MKMTFLFDRHSLALLGIFAAAFCVSCAEDSALSDVAIIDPGVLRPEITLGRTVDGAGAVENEATVYLYDKNDNSVKLKDGGVAVTGVELAIDYTSVGDAPYYRLPQPSSLEIAAGTTYVFTITLGDGSTYDVSITTQGDTLDSFTAPAILSQQTDLDVAWTTVVLEDNEDFYVTVEPTGTSYNGTDYNLFVSDTENTNGLKSIAKDYFDDPRATEVTTNITRSISEIVLPPFASGGEISSALSQVRVTVLTD